MITLIIFSIFTFADSYDISKASHPVLYADTITSRGATGDNTPVRIADSDGFQVTTGNVGIGTISPEQKLHVSGSMHLNGNMYLGAPIGVDDGDKDVLIKAHSGWVNIGNGRDLYLEAGVTDNTAGWHGGNLFLRPGQPTAPAVLYGNVIIADQGGNVGIGTVSPTAKLHIGGAAGVDGIKFPDGTLQTTAAAGGGSSQWVNSGSGIYYNSGNVGIGTTSPITKLTVDGQYARSAIIFAEGVNQLYGTGDSAVGSIVSVSGGSLEYGGPAARNGRGLWRVSSFPQTITFTNTNSWWNHAIIFTSEWWRGMGSGNRMPKSYLLEKSTDGNSWTTVSDVTDNTKDYAYHETWDTPYVRLTVREPQDGQSQAVISNFRILFTHNSGPANGPWVLASNTGNVVYQGGNVGIDIASPKNRLDVNGAVAIGSFAGANSGPSNGAIISGNVGIGTAVPTAPLHSKMIDNVVPTAATANSLASLRLSGGTGLHASQLLFGSSGGVDNQYWIQAGKNQAEGDSPPLLTGYTLRLNPLGGATRLGGELMVDSTGNSYINGNLGIGIANPVNKLSVVNGVATVTKSNGDDAKYRPIITGGSKLAVADNVQTSLFQVGYDTVATVHLVAFINENNQMSKIYHAHILYGSPLITEESSHSYGSGVTSISASYVNSDRTFRVNVDTSSGQAADVYWSIYGVSFRNGDGTMNIQ